MKHLMTACAAGIAATALAQSIPNPGFESECVFDLTGWEQFCTTTDTYPTDGHGSCYALLLPASMEPDPCVANNEAIGVHTLMSGFQVGVPYSLSIWTLMSDPDLGSDIGIFGVPAGWPPYYTTGYYFQSWPVGLGNAPGSWTQATVTFTPPPIAAGLDLYFFIEYSIAPDLIPGTKAFDDISFTDLSTSVEPATALSSGAWPSPATDKLYVNTRGTPTALQAIDATGRVVQLSEFRQVANTLEVNVAALAPGVHILRWSTSQGEERARLVKE